MDVCVATVFAAECTVSVVRSWGWKWEQRCAQYGPLSFPLLFLLPNIVMTF